VARDAWYRHWVREGLAALEAMATARAGRFLFGDAPTLADICLVPQLYNARRFEVPLDDFPTLVRADAEANRLEAFAAAHPDRVGPD
jgi:glutathione S-transferase